MTEGLSPKPREVEGGPKRGRVGAILPAVELNGHFNFKARFCCRFTAGAVAGNKRLKFQLQPIAAQGDRRRFQTDATASRRSDCRSIAVTAMLTRYRGRRRVAA
jgi:hypothetical protein